MLDAYAAGLREWPEIELDRTRFREYLEARGLGPDAANGADLYLACACALGELRAIAAFEHTLLSRLPLFLAKVNPNEELIDELKQVLRERLLTGAAPKIAGYTGKGPLGAWLRVVAIRAALELKQSAERPRPDASDLALAESNPELQALCNRYRPLFSEAFRVAFAKLETQQRNLLRLHYLDRVSMDELGKMFGVNRTTIFRRISACTTALERAIRAHLGEQLGLSTAEFKSLAHLVASDLELSLSGLLRSQR